MPAQFIESRMRDSKLGRRTRGTAAGLLSLLMAVQAWAADAATGNTKAAQCFACHGADGMAKTPDAPNLAGQNESYLAKALNDYKSGARRHEVMSLMARNLTESDIAQLAAYYSGIVITVKRP
jgi:cytochrome c553